MEIISMVLGYLPMLLVVLILIGGTIALILNQRKTAREWLLLAVTESEKALGGGTGKLKLRQAYQAFLQNFGIFAKFVRFETFEKWVSVSLEEMKKLLETNKKVEEYVKGDE